MTDTRQSEKPPWETYDEDLAKNIRFPNAPKPEKFYETSSNQTNETLARLKEENTASVKKYKFSEQDELEMIKIRTGRILHANEFLYRLRKISDLKVWYKDTGALKGTVGLWVSRGEKPHYIVWVQYPYMTEYSILHLDSHGLPLNERFRGWRTCLLQLILQGIITENQANYLFGEAKGPASFRYRKQLYGFRNRSKTF